MGGLWPGRYMAIIAALVPTVAHLQRLRTALRNRHELVACADWTALLRACERQPVQIAIVDLFASGRPAIDRVRRLKQHLPRTTLIAYVTYSVDRAHDVFDAARHGLDGLIIADRDDAPLQLLSTVEGAEEGSLGASIRRWIGDGDPLIRDAMLLAVARAHQRLAPEGLARLLGTPRRTLAHRLHAAGYPSPQRLLTWGRLVVAAHLLEQKHRSADRVATTLHFPSGSAFRNTCQRYLHATPGQIRARGGSTYVLRTLLRQISGPRRGSGDRRAPGAVQSSARMLALAV